MTVNPGRSGRMITDYFCPAIEEHDWAIYGFNKAVPHAIQRCESRAGASQPSLNSVFEIKIRWWGIIL